jgi:hypothetical protein
MPRFDQISGRDPQTREEWRLATISALAAITVAESEDDRGHFLLGGTVNIDRCRRIAEEGFARGISFDEIQPDLEEALTDLAVRKRGSQARLN